MTDVINSELSKKYRGAIGLSLASVNILFHILLLYILMTFNLVYLNHAQDFIDFVNELIPFVFGLSIITLIVGLIYFISGFKYSSKWVRIISLILYIAEITFLVLPSISESLFFKFVFWVAYLGA